MALLYRQLQVREITGERPATTGRFLVVHIGLSDGLDERKDVGCTQHVGDD